MDEGGDVTTTLHLSIVCGDKTCFDFDAQQMCQHVRTTHMGTRYHCAVFSDHSGRQPEQLREVDECLQRHPKCLAAETADRKAER